MTDEHRHDPHTTPVTEPRGGEQDPEEGVADPQEAHGGSMAPGVVDDTGHQVGERESPGRELLP